MASFVLATDNRYPQGTSVAVYPVSNWGAAGVDQSAAPVGSATNTQTMGATNATFTGLTPGVEYVAYASVNSQKRYTHLSVSDEVADIVAVSQAEYDALTPSNTTLYVIVG